MKKKEFEKNIKEIEKNFFDMLPEFFSKGISYKDAKIETINTIINDEKYSLYLEQNLKLKNNDEKTNYLFLNFF